MKQLQTQKRIRRLFCALLVVFLLAASVPAAPGLFVPTANAASAKKIKLSDKSLVLSVTESYQLTVSGTKETVKWASGNASVASVSKKGVVSAKAVGSAVIVAKVAGKKLKCKVTVKPALSTNVTSLTVPEGKKKPIEVTFSLSGYVKYELQNSSVATCHWGDQWNGEKMNLFVTAKHPGVTNLILTNTETSDTVTVKIYVKPTNPPLSPAKNSVSLDAGKYTSMIVLAREYGELVCSVADENIAEADIWLANSYDQFELVIVGKAAGTTTVTIKNKSTGSKVNVQVTVTGGVEVSSPRK